MFMNPSGETTPARGRRTSIRHHAQRRRHRRESKPSSERHGEKIHLEVVSMIAALRADSGAITWSGEIARDELLRFVSGGQAATRGPLNAAIVRYFNRVDRADRDRLDRLGYHLPSLSAGDIFAVHGIAFVVATIGCERISGDENRLRRFVTSWLHQD